jgi:alanine racemase
MAPGVVCVDEGRGTAARGSMRRFWSSATQAAEAERIVDLRLTLTVGTMQVALALSRFAAARGVVQRIHVELESGLNRHGLELEPLVRSPRVRAAEH